MRTHIIIEAANQDTLDLALALLQNLQGITIQAITADQQVAEEALDLILIAERQNETPIDWEIAKKMLAEGITDGL